MLITDVCPIGRLTVNMLSNDVLLYIFDLYRQKSKNVDDVWPWHTLVHVCQRWRHVIFAWPYHLDLQLQLNRRSGTDVAEALDIWPANVLINIQSNLDLGNGDDIAAALGHRDRITTISILCRRLLQLERCSTVTQGPFPVLRTFSLHCYENGGHAAHAPVVTDSLLGGYAPRLQKITLCGVPFPTLPNLLLSTKDLVELHLDGIPSAGYISPDALATCLSMLKRLEFIEVRFQSFPGLTNLPPPPLTRAVLPALKRFEFEGVCKYSEDLIARIDAPLLRTFSLELSQQPNFDISQVPQFLSRIEIFKPPFTGDIILCDSHIDASLLLPGFNFTLRLKCDWFFTPASLVEEIFTQFLPHTSHVHNLKFFRDYAASQEDSALWLGVFRLFTAVQVLDVDGDTLGLDVAHILSDVEVSRAAEVLPMLHTIVMDELEDIGPEVTSILGPFLDARKLSDRPVAIVDPE
jgi:hypothetical protein